MKIKIIYGILIQKEIIESSQMKLKNTYAVNENYYVCGFEVDCNGDYLKLNFKTLDDYAKSEEQKNLFSEYLPKILEIWTNFLQQKTQEFKNLGLNESEVEEKMSIYDLPEYIDIDFY